MQASSSIIYSIHRSQCLCGRSLDLERLIRSKNYTGFCQAGQQSLPTMKSLMERFNLLVLVEDYLGTTYTITAHHTLSRTLYARDLRPNKTPALLKFLVCNREPSGILTLFQIPGLGRPSTSPLDHAPPTMKSFIHCGSVLICSPSKV